MIRINEAFCPEKLFCQKKITLLQIDSCEQNILIEDKWSQRAGKRQ